MRVRETGTVRERRFGERAVRGAHGVGLAASRAERLEIDVLEVRRELVDRVRRQVRGAGLPRVFDDEGLPVVAGIHVVRLRQAYLTPATWPSAATNRLQSSR